MTIVVLSNVIDFQLVSNWLTNGSKVWRKNMSDNKKFSCDGILPILIFVVHLVMKLTENCTFWGDNFPRFLKSTEAWWDGWFMVFLPLWVGLPIALIIFLICFIFNWIKK